MPGFFADDRLPGFDDVSDDAAEQLVRDWGYDETSDAWGPLCGWATGLLHDE